MKIKTSLKCNKMNFQNFMLLNPNQMLHLQLQLVETYAKIKNPNLQFSEENKKKMK